MVSAFMYEDKCARLEMSPHGRLSAVSLPCCLGFGGYACRLQLCLLLVLVHWSISQLIGIATGRQQELSPVFQCWDALASAAACGSLSCSMT